MKDKKSQQNDWQVNLDIFEGPLDLLLHLINELEIDIYDIPVAEITNQYLKYIHSMNILELDTAGNYLVMAATLMSIKSQMLVPRNDNIENFDEEELHTNEEDPREYLMELLIEYRKFKNVARQLKKRENERGVFMTKEPTDVSEYQEYIPLRENEVSLDDIVKTFNRVIHEHALRTPHPTIVEANEVSVTDRMSQITSQFKGERESKISFYDLIDAPLRKDIVTTFLAMLELMKNHQIIATQESIYGDIELNYIGTVENNERDIYGTND